MTYEERYIEVLNKTEKVAQNYIDSILKLSFPAKNGEEKGDENESQNK